jgi:hypothetical protein
MFFPRMCCESCFSQNLLLIMFFPRMCSQPCFSQNVLLIMFFFTIMCCQSWFFTESATNHVFPPE